MVTLSHCHDCRKMLEPRDLNDGDLCESCHTKRHIGAQWVSAVQGQGGTDY